MSCETQTRRLHLRAMRSGDGELLFFLFSATIDCGGMNRPAATSTFARQTPTSSGRLGVGTVTVSATGSCSSSRILPLSPEAGASSGIEAVAGISTTASTLRYSARVTRPNSLLPVLRQHTPSIQLRRSSRGSTRLMPLPERLPSKRACFSPAWGSTAAMGVNVRLMSTESYRIRRRTN